MKQSKPYMRFAEEFITYTIEQLIELFNREVSNNGWTSMRAYHDTALMNEFIRRGVNVAAVYNGKVISFAYPIRYDDVENRLISIK